MAKTQQVPFDPSTYPYPRCRSQHVWEFYDGHLDQKSKLGFCVESCMRCGMKRRQILSLLSSSRGKVLTRAYIPPTDYRIPGGLDSHGRGELRLRTFLHDLGQMSS